MNLLRVAFFLTWRQIARQNKRSLFLIIAVMTLTFLNLVAVSGILIGLIEGASLEQQEKYIGDIVISNLENKKNIQNTEEIVSILQTLPEVAGFSVRYIQSGSLESNFNQRDSGKRREIANTLIFGITPSDEHKVTNMGDDMLEGEFLTDDDTNKVVLGKYTVKKYAPTPDEAERAMGEVKVGDNILLTIGDKTNQFTVKGILNGKTDAARQAFVNATDIKKILGNGDNRASMISLKVYNHNEATFVKGVLVNNGLGENQKIETYAEAEPSFVKDLKKVFNILGNVIGGIGLVVAFITIFIVIYINALTRRKYIGIMKGIGIHPVSIELSYVFQSIFYGVSGSLIGSLIVYIILVPVFAAYPINFPFSDGILVAPYLETFLRFVTLMVATILAGYFPARSIIKNNTLDAILGR